MRRVPPPVHVREELNRLLERGGRRRGERRFGVRRARDPPGGPAAARGREADFLGGRGRDERRGEGQRGSRNGYEPGRIRTAEGAIPVAVPQVRGADQPFRSSLMSFLEGNSEVSERLVAEMYARGLSTRDVEDAFRDATGELLISKSAGFRDHRSALGGLPGLLRPGPL
jgi:putative transposase